MTLGFECDIAHRVGDGLQAAVSNEYNVIIVGCLMGDQSCSILLRAIKLLLRKGSCANLIGVLSSPNPSMEQQCKDIGFDQVMIKPISKAALSDCMGRMLHISRGICENMSYQGLQRPTENSVAQTSCGNGHGNNQMLFVLQSLPKVNEQMDSRHLSLGELNVSYNI